MSYVSEFDLRPKPRCNAPMTHLNLHIVDGIPCLLRDEGWVPLPAFIEVVQENGVPTLWGPQRVYLGEVDADHMDTLRGAIAIQLGQAAGDGVAVQGEVVVVT